MTFNKNKILLIGKGYWGSIISKNIDCEFDSFDISDNDGRNIKDLIRNSTHVIVATPASTHYEIVKYSLESNCNVFCEKPLTISSKETRDLYSLSKEVNKSLYVNWIFLCNPVIRKIKSLMKDYTGNLVHASMNRLNLGPVRYDVSARFDLSSHDLSILCYLLNDENLQVEHYDYNKNDEKFAGTCHTKVNWTYGSGVINSSWNYPIKNRTCVFTFQNATIHWDDNLKIAMMNGKPITFEENNSPLQLSINSFLNNNFDANENENVTIKVMDYL